MKANELRIGNWVNVPHGDVQIERWVNDGAHFTDGNGGTFASLKPIPLTEEWLLKFGFRKFIDKHDPAVIDYVIGEPNEPLYECDLRLMVTSKGQICYRNYLHPITSVHQLQNLYFALTGEELSIKE